MSYSTLHIPIVPSERATDRRDDGPIRIPRREVFDIRMQLMASDEAVEEDDVAAGDATSRAAERLAAQTSLLLLGEDDIKTSVYEGGLKSWECSIDLVRVLARGKMRSVQGQGTGDHAHVLEVITDTSCSNDDSPSTTTPYGQCRSHRKFKLIDKIPSYQYS